MSSSVLRLMSVVFRNFTFAQKLPFTVDDASARIGPKR